MTADAVRRIQAMIRSGRFPPGATLPGQRELASELGVSRASLREAVSILATLGLVRIEPRRGTVVPEHGQAGQPGHWRFGAQYTPEEVYQFRAIAEGQAAALAAMHVTDDEVVLLRRNLAGFKEAIRRLDLVSVSHLDFDFHQLVMRFSRNRMLLHLHRTYHEVLLESQRLPLAGRSRVWEPVTEHERVVNALAMRDPDGAGYYMRSHLLQAAARIGVTVTGVS